LALIPAVGLMGAYVGRGVMRARRQHAHRA
jgi:hypothetical protein